MAIDIRQDGRGFDEVPLVAGQELKTMVVFNAGDYFVTVYQGDKHFFVEAQMLDDDGGADTIFFTELKEKAEAEKAAFILATSVWSNGFDVEVSVYDESFKDTGERLSFWLVEQGREDRAIPS